VHVLQWPEGEVLLPVPPRRVIAARVLSGAPAVVRQSDAGLRLFVAPADRADPDTVVVLDLARG
jgi:hypothetical protein